MRHAIGALGVIVLVAACGRKAEAPAARDGAAAAPARDAGLTLAGAWTVEQTRPLIEKTQRIRLEPDLAHLSAGERAAVAKLLEVGAIMQELYEEQRHVDAAAARQLVAGLDASERSEHLRTLYRLFQGPIANTLDNQRVPFLGVRPIAPGKTVYPGGIEGKETDARGGEGQGRFSTGGQGPGEGVSPSKTGPRGSSPPERAEIDTFLAAHPERREAFLAPRTVVRRADETSLAADLAALARHPALDTLHPGLRAELEALRRAPAGLYALPYSVAYADRLVLAHALLAEAASAVAASDPELAGYLRNRGRDLLSDDYESGDAAWVTAEFRNLNVQIGSYETYDDELYGAKTFFALSLLARRPADSDAVRAAIGSLQAFEDSLPYQRRKKVRDRIPVGVYDVIADFGQARGGNTATILPNEAYLARRYGRTILLRANIMRSPEVFDSVDRGWTAAVAPAHASELTADGTFQRTLWHEIGHYVGVDTTRDGRTLADALGDTADLLEEMKADLVSLFVVEALRGRGYYDDAKLRAVYAAGISRVLQNNRPRRDQPYNTMQLMQWNFFLDRGLLRFDPAAGTLAIDYGRYHTVVGELLGRVLAVQDAGDKAAADAFVEQLTRWDDRLHGVTAQRIRDQQRYRFRLFRYAALGE